MAVRKRRSKTRKVRQVAGAWKVNLYINGKPVDVEVRDGNGPGGIKRRKMHGVQLWLDGRNIRLEVLDPLPTD